MRRVDYLNDPTAPRANSIVIATSVYIEDDTGRILLIRRTDNGLWALPGGGLDLGETVTECAVRETKEESGIDVEVSGLVGIYTNPAHVVAYTDGEVRQQFSICLRARMLGGSPRTSDESSEVEWIPRDQLDRLDIHPDTRRRIDRGIAHDPTPYVD